jgi:hypothetical protein
MTPFMRSVRLRAAFSARTRARRWHFGLSLALRAGAESP